MLQNSVSLGEPELCGMNLAQAHTHLKTEFGIWPRTWVKALAPTLLTM